MKEFIKYVGLDVHKKTIDIVTADNGRDGEVRYYGTIGGDLASLEKAIKKIKTKGAILDFVYEAGPCGYEIYRHLSKMSYKCSVVAPSLIPKRPGDRIKTDRRDAEQLARLYRAGELISVYVPLEEDEAIRDLIRGREDAIEARRKGKQRLLAFLLRQGVRYPGDSYWTSLHLRWLSEIKMPTSAQQITLQEYINAVHECDSRVGRLTQQIEVHVNTWRMKPIVKAFQALRGVSLLVAATSVAEIGDFGRFANPKHLMAYLGLVPSEHSTGEKTKRGGITKCGNGHVRRSLIEAGQAYSHPARITRPLLKRQENLPQSVVDISWKAQVRLCSRFKRLMAKGKARNVVVTAMARELCAFMWAISKEMEAKRN